MNDTLNEALRRAQNGDQRAFDTVVRLYQNRTVGYAYSLLGDRAAAEDAAQEAFLQAFRDLPKLTCPEAFPSWLRRIVFKFCDRARRSQRPMTSWDQIAEMPDHPETDPARSLSTRDDRQATERLTRRVVAALPPGERIVVTLYYFGDRNQEEVAAFLDVPITTVKKRLQRARARLREGIATMIENTLQELAPSRDDRFVEVANLLRRITTLLENDPRVRAAYLDHFGADEGFGGADDAWASLNVHVVVDDAEIEALADRRLAFVTPVGGRLMHQEAEQNAPPGGYYLMTWFDGEAGPYEVDWYWHPLSRTVLPKGAHLLFNRVSLPVSDEPYPWKVTDDIPEALRRLQAARTKKEQWDEKAWNTLALFWAMWLITAKYVARNPNEEQMGFLPFLRHLIRDLRRHLGDSVTESEADDNPPYPLPADKLAILRALSAEVETEIMPHIVARGAAVPEKIVPRAHRFLAMVESTLPS